MFRQIPEMSNILLDSVSEGVIVVDEHQNIVKTNNCFEQMFGYEINELINRPFNILIPQNYRAKHDIHFKGFMKNGKRSQKVQGRNICGLRKDGSIFLIEMALNLFTIYDKNFVMALFVDVSFREEQDEKIRESNTFLEDKVKERTKELKTAIDDLRLLNIKLDRENRTCIQAENEAKEALRIEQGISYLKTRFLSMISHEFITPLSGILTSTMLLSKYKLENQQEKRDKHIKIITDKVQFLTNTLNDFLSIEKLEKGQINYSPSIFKLSKVISQVANNAKTLLKDGQKINYPKNLDELSLHQDEKTVDLILSNLVNNAVKYSLENTIVDIYVTQNKKTTVFKIKDRGIGIPENDQENIFNRYFRAENALMIHGTGIGLNIIKEHLDNLKGTICFKSQEGKGSVFTIELPNTF